jgi:hypothetical protein
MGFAYGAWRTMTDPGSWRVRRHRGVPTGSAS